MKVNPSPVRRPFRSRGNDPLGVPFEVVDDSTSVTFGYTTHPPQTPCPQTHHRSPTSEHRSSTPHRGPYWWRFVLRLFPCLPSSPPSLTRRPRRGLPLGSFPCPTFVSRRYRTSCLSTRVCVRPVGVVDLVPRTGVPSGVLRGPTGTVVGSFCRVRKGHPSCRSVQDPSSTLRDRPDSPLLAHVRVGP